MVVAVSFFAEQFQLDFTLRIGNECAICGRDLGYVFKRKGF